MGRENAKGIAPGAERRRVPFGGWLQNKKPASAGAPSGFFATSRVQASSTRSFTKKPAANAAGFLILAERGGFEPPVRLPVHALSKRAPSATRTPLLVYN